MNEFYEQPDSIYIRLQYIEDKDAFKFTICNQLALSGIEPTNSLMIMDALARGAIETLITNPKSLYALGVVDQMRQEVLTSKDYTDDQKKLFDMEPKGNA